MKLMSETAAASLSSVVSEVLKQSRVSVSQAREPPLPLHT
jgi:hypothetical protein